MCFGMQGVVVSGFGEGYARNLKPLHPKTLNPKPLNPKSLNPKP